MNEKKFTITIVIVSILILVGGISFISSTNTSAPQVAASSKAKASFDKTDFDWGKINYNGPKATKIFIIKNTGTDNLKLFNIKTSCHCTKAHVTIDNVNSPEFGMTGIFSWVGEIKPGDEAKLVIVFDQAYHGLQGTGPIVRYTSVETNDPSNSKITFTTSGTVFK